VELDHQTTSRCTRCPDQPGSEHDESGRLRCNARGVGWCLCCKGKALEVIELRVLVDQNRGNIAWARR